ncbi:hypothetical protein EV421DRAFT_1756659 [Armillaria borealis]|uniref:Uncharacterized protein n=1 Tax=Armillaria borealis TaxID=47425 RepID=A0AA39K6U2_9AGAR|nr:hypothetical protein EV421DRAFT_1756659 [Armillaria borealis]
MLTPLVVHSASGRLFPCTGGYLRLTTIKAQHPTIWTSDSSWFSSVLNHFPKTPMMQTRLLLSIFLALCTMNIMATPSRRGTNHCSNGAKIDKDETRWASDGCDPSDSKGLKSAHNCKNAGGKYYLCKQGDTWTCSKVKNMLGLEKGECFL